MNIKTAIAAAVLAVTSVGSFATTTNLGPAVVGTPLSFNSGMVPVNGPFSDFFTFTLPTNAGTGISVIDFPILGIFATNLSTLSFYSNADGIVGNGDDVLVNSVSAISNKLNLAWGPSSAGSYYINITGASAGAFGGLYNGAITVTAVPEPETFAMLLAGLGLMGAIARRRNKTNAA